MTINLRYISYSAIGVVALLGASVPAFAGSAATDAYVANIRESMDTLTQSSFLAADRSQSDAIRAFAAREIGTGDVLAVDPSITVDTPITVASNMSVGPVDADGTQIGRSAATDMTVDPAVFEAPLGTGAIMPTAQWSMSYLSTTDGKGFDWTYKAVQENALTSLVGFYDAYSQTGDDPALRATAIGELPKIKARLAELHSL